MEAECWTRFECRRHCTTSNSRTAWNRSSDSLASSCSVRVCLAWDWLRIYIYISLSLQPSTTIRKPFTILVAQCVIKFIIIYIYWIVTRSLDFTRLKSALLPTWSTSGRGKSLRIQVSPGVKGMAPLHCPMAPARHRFPGMPPGSPRILSEPKEKNHCSGICGIGVRTGNYWWVLAFFCRLVGSLAWKVISDPTIQVNSCHHQSVRCLFQTACNEQHELLIVVVKVSLFIDLEQGWRVTMLLQKALQLPHICQKTFRVNYFLFIITAAFVEPYVQGRQKVFDREGGVLHFLEVAEPFKPLVFRHWKAGIAIKSMPFGHQGAVPIMNTKGQAFQELFPSDGRWFAAQNSQHSDLWRKLFRILQFFVWKDYPLQQRRYAQRFLQSILHHGHARVRSDLDFDDVSSHGGDLQVSELVCLGDLGAWVWFADGHRMDARFWDQIHLERNSRGRLDFNSLDMIQVHIVPQFLQFITNVLIRHWHLPILPSNGKRTGRTITMWIHRNECETNATEATNLSQKGMTMASCIQIFGQSPKPNLVQSKWTDKYLHERSFA